MPLKRSVLFFKMALQTELPVYRDTYKLVLEIFVSKRIKGNFYESIQKQNKLIENNKKPNIAEKHLFLSSMNSYLGILCKKRA